MTGGARTDKEYWSLQWRPPGLPACFDGRRYSFRRHAQWQMHRLFARVIPRGAELVEVGCAQSIWLPYFGRERGCRVTGIDYSAEGCAKSRAMLEAAGVDGKIVEVDLFSPPPDLLGRFDVVVSLGLAEHFDPTSDCVAALAALLRPGGLMVTLVPNLAGLLGVVQKRLDRAVYDLHVVIDKETLADAHAKVGLEVAESGYLLFTSNWVLNANLVPSRLERWAKTQFVRLLGRLSQLCWAAELLTGPWPANRWTSPYVFCVARKAGPA